MNNFCTSKFQDEKYNKSLYGLVFLMQYSLAKLFDNPDKLVRQVFSEDKFIEHFNPIFSKLKSIEKLKKNPPKYTFAFQNLKKKMCKTEMSQTNSWISTSSHSGKYQNHSIDKLKDQRRKSTK